MSKLKINIHQNNYTKTVRLSSWVEMRIRNMSWLSEKWKKKKKCLLQEVV